MANKYMKKILNILVHKGNVNQNDIEISPVQSEWLSSRTQTTNVGEDVEGKGILIHCW
jgi:hypothetical protein